MALTALQAATLMTLARNVVRLGATESDPTTERPVPMLITDAEDVLEAIDNDANPDDERVRDLARTLHANGDELEIDDDAIVSRNDTGGAWVAAWVYVSEAELIDEDDDSDEEEDEPWRAITIDEFHRAMEERRVRVECPHCQSADVRELNTAAIFAPVTAWTVNESGMIHSEEVDVSEPGEMCSDVDRDGNGYQCGNWRCQTPLSEETLCIRIDGERVLVRAPDAAIATSEATNAAV